MFNLIRLVFALLLIVLITPQTDKENIVLRKFHESGFFMNYNEAKHFLNRITWISIGFFLIITLI
jgi:protein translocase SecG subunit|uniref:Probable protein-export membrane protein SecG n=1 Tax=Binuclearia lauterbornii TaxID=3087189 RepID=A0A097KPF4_9CHLO|nr:hypothetical chloroplast RF47 [Binuclearia lauterbornii]AIT95063.1 hypothetical chloroplast RF47 [Binuclearia lauterbornii]